jgi:hypothetical protein
MNENDATISISRVPTNQGDRVLIAINSESGLGDFARVYLHPSTTHALRAALEEAPDHVLAWDRSTEPERPAWTVKIEGEATLTVHALTDYDAIVTGVQHLHPSATDIRWTERGDDFEARVEVDGRSVRVAFLATATPSTTEST